MSGPYFTTFINTETCVPPNQLNSNILTHIKQNLIRKYKGKCFYKLGYIMDIYSVEGSIGDGTMRPEDNSGSVYYDIQFKAKICNPMNQSVIVARVEDVNKHMIIARNGPIIIVIDGQNFNYNKFKYNNVKNALFPLTSQGKEINKRVVQGTYILTKVINKRMTDRDEKIMVLGSLEDLATDEMVKENMRNEHSTDDEITEVQQIFEMDNVEEENEEHEQEQEQEEEKEHEKEEEKEEENVVESEEESETELSIDSSVE